MCVAWQLARSHRLPRRPLLSSYLTLPFSLSFLHLIPCFPSLLLFLFPANFLPSFSSYLPLSPSLSPPVSNHSPSISFSPSLHSCFLLHLSLSLSLSLLPPSPLISFSPGLRSSEQVLSPFDLGAFGLMLSAQLLKQLPLPDASQFGAGAVTYTHIHTHTHIFKHPNIRTDAAVRTPGTYTHTHTQTQGLLAHCNAHKANQLLYANLVCNPGVCFCSLSKSDIMTRYYNDH